MDKKILLRIFYIVTSAPIAVLSIILFLVDKRIRVGYHQSKEKIVPIFNKENIIALLVCAEDRRFYSHLGVDPIAILRAIYRILKDGKLEGASTIEQQYVRTCTASKEISFSRKMNEIAISLILSITTRKKNTAHSYLTHAYYGHSIVGPEDAVRILRKSCLSEHCIHESAIVVALLKRPIPKLITKNWCKKLRQRLFYINREFKIGTPELLTDRSIRCHNSEDPECLCSNANWLPSV